MHLSEKIMDLRKKSGWSQEELAEKLGISRQSVSKWETGESVPDLDKIIRMSELWNVSTDYLLKEGREPEEPGAASGQEYSSYRRVYEEKQDTPRVRMVSGEEAGDFLELNRSAAPRIAAGVLLCILSPICLLVLGALTEKHPLLKGAVLVSENIAGGVGVTVLLIFVAIAVALFITSGMRLSTYEYMEKELLQLPPDVSEEVYDRKTDFSRTFRYSITTGVLLCMIGVIPLMLSIAFMEDDLVQVIGLCILLVFVAAGVFFIVYAGIIQDSFEKLLQTGDYTPGRKKMEGVSRVYWSVVVAVYLLISLTGIADWGRSWVIFPVAGVLFGGISVIVNRFYR